ncbi:MAG: hypothetical protein JO279_11860 [Verrucomicrobia bacterium]|nr:hypothetical protein [Verrucomicrobiota bacterium]
MKEIEIKVESISRSKTIGRFVLILKPNPFPLNPKFSGFRFEPDFESITTEMKVDHVQVYSTKKPPFRVGQSITIFYELQTDQRPSVPPPKPPETIH